MLQGSPGEINTPVLRCEPSWEWLGQQRCSRDLLSPFGDKLLDYEIARKKRCFWGFFLSFLPFVSFLPLSSWFLVMENTTIAWAGLKPSENADFNARWENTGGYTVGKQSLLTSKKRLQVFQPSPSHFSRRALRGEEFCSLSSLAVGWAGCSRRHLCCWVLGVTSDTKTGRGGGQHTIKHWKGRRQEVIIKASGWKQ